MDLAEYTQSEQSTLEAVTDEYADSPDKVPELQHPDRLTARVRLYATPQVGESWAALVRAMKRVRWEWFEGDVKQRWMADDLPGGDARWCPVADVLQNPVFVEGATGEVWWFSDLNIVWYTDTELSSFAKLSVSEVYQGR